MFACAFIERHSVSSSFEIDDFRYFTHPSMYLFMFIFVQMQRNLASPASHLRLIAFYLIGSILFNSVQPNKSCGNGKTIALSNKINFLNQPLTLCAYRYKVFVLGSYFKSIDLSIRHLHKNSSSTHTSDGD